MSVSHFMNPLWPNCHEESLPGMGLSQRVLICLYADFESRSGMQPMQDLGRG